MTFPLPLRHRMLCTQLLLALLFLPLAVSAQQAKGTINFLWGDKYELPEKHKDVCFIGSEADGYIQVGHATHRSISFQRFDEKLHLVGTNTVDLDNMPADYRIVGFARLGKKYYWYFCTWERKDETERLFVQEINVKTAQLTGKAKEICATSKLVGMDAFFVGGGWFGAHSPTVGFSLVDKWNLYYSVDSTKVLVQYRKRPETRSDAKNNDIIGFQVFDEEMNKIWGNEIRMPYTEKKMDNIDYTVDKDGNVYTLATVYNEDKGDKKSPNYRMEILKWTKDSKEVTKIPFKTGTNFLNTAIITKDYNNSLMVVGYYSKKRNSASTDGVMLLKLDEKSGELTNVKKGLYEFPATVLSEFESARTKRRNERKDDEDGLEANYLELRNVVVSPDGSMQIFGEEYHMRVQRTYGRNVQTTYHFYYDDILAMNIGGDGELKWVTKVPKQQYGINTGQGGMSFKLFSHKGNHYLFFMDNIKNVDISPDEAPSKHVDRRGGVLMAVKIDENGKKSKSKVFDIREEDMNIIVSNFDELGADKMIGRAFHRKESQPFFVSFQ